ncbi:DUF6642 family protein [Flavobacterium selenitireducens]|uniref:DUF6642 family protein n=1 Tax=Flavobacterium selenitireducens TaxID=2722704 RepID=UPI00168A66D0|nr:DUF6642 family protein [Flavobacterium selenitireducens]MBD3581944.1 hypothetical protein [Flavobacterium selenitireducens]
MIEEKSKLYCLEAVTDAGKDRLKLLPLLEHLAMEHDIPNVYQSCDDIATFEQSLNDLLYEDKDFKTYEVIYLVVEGAENHIQIRGYTYSLEEIAELFEGKLSKKIVHFRNSKTLDIDIETAQYFLDVTGAKALSGYTEESNFDSSFLDSKLFGYYYNDTDDVAELVKMLLENYNAACQALGFRLFY